MLLSNLLLLDDPVTDMYTDPPAPLLAEHPIKLQDDMLIVDEDRSDANVMPRPPYDDPPQLVQATLSSEVESDVTAPIWCIPMPPPSQLVLLPAITTLLMEMVSESDVCASKIKIAPPPFRPVLSPDVVADVELNCELTTSTLDISTAPRYSSDKPPPEIQAAEF